MSAVRHQYRVFIRASLAEVWNAIIDPAFTRRYFHGTAYEAPLVQGEPYRSSIVGAGPAVDGRVEVLEAPHRLVMTWHTLYDPALAAEPASRVEWRLSLAGPGLTQLDLVHSDLDASPKTAENVREGWTWILNALKTLVETGEPLPSVARA